MLGDGKLNENEKKEYEKALEKFKSTMEKLSREDYRKQLLQKKLEFFGNWAVNETQRQLDQAKTLRANFEKMFD
jgi:hypothetical protein